MTTLFWLYAAAIVLQTVLLLVATLAPVLNRRKKRINEAPFETRLHQMRDVPYGRCSKDNKERRWKEAGLKIEMVSPTGKKATLIKGESLSEAKALVAQGVRANLVLTDPPYIIKHLGGGGCFKESNRKCVGIEDGSPLDGIRDGYDVDAYMDVWVNGLEASNVLVFCSNDQVAEHYLSMEKYGLSPTIMVWFKHNACPMTSFTWKPDVEYIVVGRRLGKGGFMNNDVDSGMKSRVRTHPMCNERRWHPTAKPVKLLIEFIEVLCPADGVVFDPFAGSGSTPIAALRALRDTIAIEADIVQLEGGGSCFEKMLTEVKAEVSQRRLF